MQLTGCGVKTEFENRVLTVRLTGEIDHHNAGKMRMEIDEAICHSRPRRLVFDLDGIDFMDSSGLGLIMGRYAVIQRMGGDMILRNPSERVKKIIDLSGLDRIVHIEYEKGGKAK